MSAGVPVIIPLIGLGDAFGTALSVTTARSSGHISSKRFMICSVVPDGAFTKKCSIATSRNSSSRLNSRSPYVSAPVGLSDAS
eukprot:6352322-Karenia_brevis.AAC.1